MMEVHNSTSIFTGEYIMLNYFIILGVLLFASVIYFRVICKDVGGLSKGLIEFRLFHNHAYSEDVDTAISMLIAKYNQGLITAELDSFEYSICFSDGCSVWIGNKYYGYGFLYRYVGGKEIPAANRRRCSTKTFRELQKLENKLRAEKLLATSKDVTISYGSNKEGENIVL